MAAGVIRVVVVDDHPLFRAGVAAALDDDPGVSVVGTCGDGLTALDLVEEQRPDVVILDLGLPSLPGAEVNRRLALRAARPRVLVLTWQCDEGLVVRLADEGAAGLIVKDAEPSVLLRAVHRVAEGGTWFPLTLRSSVAIDAVMDPWDALTDREREVAILTGEGFSCEDAGARLGISRRTVEVHRGNLYRKLRVASATELVRYLVRRGLLGSA